MASTWRFLTFDMKTFQPTSEIPEVGTPSVAWEVNEPETMQVIAPLNPSEFTYNIDPQLYMPPRGGLAVEKDGVLIAAGPILNHTYDFRQGTVTINAKGIYEILKRRFDNHYHHFQPSTALSANDWVPAADNLIGWDQAYIVRFLVREAQGDSFTGYPAIPNAWLNINTDVFETNTYRDYEYFAAGLKSYYDILQDLANLEDGFNLRFHPRWKNGIRNSQIEWTTEVLYPPSGRVTNLLFELGGNADFESATIDGSQVAFAAWSVGSGDGNTNLVGYNQDLQYIMADYYLAYVDREHANVTRSATANSYARQARLRRMRAANIPAVIMPIDTINDFIIGDQCRIKANIGFYQVDEMFRIMKSTADIGQGLVKLEVAPVSIAGT